MNYSLPYMPMPTGKLFGEIQNFNARALEAESTEDGLHDFELPPMDVLIRGRANKAGDPLFDANFGPGAIMKQTTTDNLPETVEKWLKLGRTITAIEPL